MHKVTHQIYVISDLHIGGAYPDGDDPSDRGFRLCTHVPELVTFVRTLAAKPACSTPKRQLIINGDFIDFLAEECPGEQRWKPFIDDPHAAAECLDAIIERDRALFDALKDLLAAGHHLTLILGNHDVELSFPEVRRRLEKAICVTPQSRFEFIYDGEAYAVGDAVIEHGNRYDGFNVIDHDGLRRVRSYQSRREPIKEAHDFRRPPGSAIVATVMNPIKERYPFIDLLKPEDSACVPILLALAPGVRNQLGRIVKYATKAAPHSPGKDSQPRFEGDIAATESATVMDEGDMSTYRGDLSEADHTQGGADSTRLRMNIELENLLVEKLGKQPALEFCSSVDAAIELPDDGGDHDIGEDISTRSILATAKLLFAREKKPLRSRLRTLLSAVRVVQGDPSFVRDIEHKPKYSDAAKHLISRGFKYVVFGHTHLAKRVQFDKGVYLNSGTWADLMKFPEEIVSAPEEAALEYLGEFCEALEKRDIARWVKFIPTFVRLDFDAAGKVLAGEVYDYEPGQELK
jgi:UDP-2,3-diacylglucosamine pyrophosphatase LpxH